MIDHTGVIVSDFEQSKAWYEAALAPLRYGKLMEFSKEVTGFTNVAGFGELATHKPDFWISGAVAGREVNEPRVHVAFRAKTHAEVDAFYNSAIKAGGKDNGKPGPRPHYHESYYGGFVLDPDGHNIEAVCFCEQAK
jgi:catechol 2,3-dioxygenase-like lactoylglutathione lyase family enzyme